MRSKPHLATLAAVLTGLAGITPALAQEKSGPQPGQFLPTSFAPYNVNGTSKGLHHSLVCEYGLRPTVMVFVRERPAGKDDAVFDLLKKLDESLAKYQAEGLAAFVVYLSPDAQSSITNEKAEEVDKVLEEEERREKLKARMAPVGEQFKRLIVCLYPAEGHRGYELSPKTEVTVVLYDRLKVEANYTFPMGQFNAQSVEQVMQGVEKLMSRHQKKSSSE
jgi:hypothetical protein